MNVDFGSTEGLSTSDNEDTDTPYYSHLVRGPSMVDGAPDDLKQIIHSHWTRFPPQNQKLNEILAYLYFLFWLVNGFGNSTVIVVFMKNKSLQTPANMFVANLAVADFLMMLSQGPFYIFNVMRSNWWSFGVFACELYGFTGGVFGVAAIMSMMFIGIDRFLVITQGISGPRFNKNTAKHFIVFIWIYAIGINFPPFIGVWSKFSPEGLLTTCSFDYLDEDPWNKSYVLFIFMLAYTTPLSVLILCYSRIVFAVWAHEKSLKEQAKKMNVESLRTSKNEKDANVEMKIAMAALLSVLLWVIIWTPYAVVTLVGAYGNKSFITPVVSMIPALLAKSASCISPVVFAISHPKFQQAFKKEYSWLFCFSGGEDKQGSSMEVRSTVTGLTMKNPY